MISHVFWRDRFNSDPSVLGKSITLDGEPTRLSGLLRRVFVLNTRRSRRFSFLLRRMRPTVVLRSLDVLGRLAPGFHHGKGSARRAEAIYERELKSEGIQPEDMTVVANLREFWTNFSARPL